MSNRDIGVRIDGRSMRGGSICDVIAGETVTIELTPRGATFALRTDAPPGACEIDGAKVTFAQPGRFCLRLAAPGLVDWLDVVALEPAALSMVQVPRRSLSADDARRALRTYSRRHERFTGFADQIRHVEWLPYLSGDS